MKPRVAVLGAVALVGSVTAVPDLIQFTPGQTPFNANCLDVNPGTLRLTTYWCHGGLSQLFEYVENRYLRPSLRPNSCLEYGADNSVYLTTTCDGRMEQQWALRSDGTLAAVGYDKFGKCLDGVGPAYNTITLVDCNSGRAAQIMRSSNIKPATGVTLRATSGVCLDTANENPVVYGFSCHGGVNQVWDYTYDDELRTMGDKCLDISNVNTLTLGVSKCNPGNAPNQRWAVQEMTGKIMSLAFPDKCVDISTNPGKLISCANLPNSAKFPIKPLLTARINNMKRMRIQATTAWSFLTCLVQNGAILHAHPCRSEIGYWWEMTAQNTIKVGDQCLDIPAAAGAPLNTKPCTGATNQQWNLDPVTGALTSPSANGKCATVSSTGGEWTLRTLSMQNCNPAAPTVMQVFRWRQFPQSSAGLPVPSRADAQQEYCSQRGGVSDPAVLLNNLRNLLVYKNDLSYLVPSALTDREEYTYYSSVVLQTLSLTIGSQTLLLPETSIVEKLGTANRQVLLDLAETMCRVRDRDAELRPKLREWFRITQTDGSMRLGTVFGYLRMAGLMVQSTVLPGTAASLAIVSNDAAKDFASQLKSYMDANDVNGFVSFATGSDVTWFNQQVEPACALQPSLAVCGISKVTALAAARTALLSEVTRALSVLAKTNEIVTPGVEDKADAFVKAYRASTPTDSKTWSTYAQFLIFGRMNSATTYARADLMQTTNSAAVTMALALWPYFSTSEMTTTVGWASFYAALDTQLHDARRTEIQRIVYSMRARTLEAYMDGRSSDMNYLATQLLPRACIKFGSSKVCALVKFHTLTSTRADLERAIWLESTIGILNSDIQQLGVQFANVFGASVSLNDALWTATAARLLFDSVEKTIYPSKTLLATARPEQFLRIYAVLAAYSSSMSPLLPYFNLLLDQVTGAHFNAISTLVSNRDVNGMVAYMNESAGTSDFGIHGVYVLPVVCNNPNNPDFSVCKLQEFYSGLLQVVAFERSRKSNVVSLTELAEVDVRKQLDVVDQENKQFEIINAIQDSANKVGAKIDEESSKIQELVKTETAAIRSDIASSQQILFNKMGEEGKKIQASIDESTKQLEDTIGEAANAIRSDITKNTKLLYDKMDAESRALQKSIDDNTKKLSTQIGAEAAATRKLINDSTNKLFNKMDAESKAIRNKIDQSTAKLYDKIGSEGAAIRKKIDDSTEQLSNKIGEEGRKTRDKIDSATRDLTNVINDRTDMLAGKIDTSTGQIVNTFKSGFTALADYYQADASANTQQLQKVVSVSMSATDGLYAEFDQNRIQPFKAALQEALRLMSFVAVAQGLVIGAKAGVAASEVILETAKCFSIGAWIAGTADPGKAIKAATEVTELVGSLQTLNEDEFELKRQGGYFEAAMKDASTVSGQLRTMGTTLKSVLNEINVGIKNPKPEDTKKFTDNVMKVYNTFNVPMSQTQISSMKERTLQFMDFMIYMIERVPTGSTAITDALREIRKARYLATPMFEAFTEVYSELGKQFETIGQLARATANQQAANNLGQAAANMGRGRRLANAPFKPLYTMAYAGLSRLFMQYKLQNAAFQFCKFYEYKNGGIPPSMCVSAGSPTKFYTPSDIQAMRSYAAPALRQYSLYALLPTRPTPASGDTLRKVFPRPYLDLEAIARGETVQFSLPVSDLQWLKTYSWVFPSDTDASLAGVYVQSMQIFMPYTPKPNTSTTDTKQRLDVLTSVAVGSNQRLNALNEKSFVIPKQQLQFSTAVNGGLCASKITNPYHEAANCVKSDGFSSLCVFEDGSLLSSDVLPSLFSTWQISTKATTTSNGFTLALPNLNKTTTDNNGDLNVLVLLKVVRVSRPSNSKSIASKMIEAASVDTCCKGDEFYSNGACAVCPSGSTGALNGYACQRL